MRHDASMDIIFPDAHQVALSSFQGMTSNNTPSIKARLTLPSIWASEKSGGAFSMRNFLNMKLNKPTVRFYFSFNNFSLIYIFLVHILFLC